MKRLLTSDPLTGIETWFHKDGAGFQLERTQDVSAILEQNKAMQNDGSGGWSKSREFRHAAVVPDVILEMWAKEAGLQMNDKAFGEVVKRKLNDPDNRFMRTGVFRL